LSLINSISNVPLGGNSWTRSWTIPSTLSELIVVPSNSTITLIGSLCVSAIVVLVAYKRLVTSLVSIDLWISLISVLTVELVDAPTTIYSLWVSDIWVETSTTATASR
jgi:hypothetical protein